MKRDKEQTGKNFFTRLMSMDDAAWERHASPLSVWTRVIISIPMILFAVWSIRLIGWWSLATITITVFWIWINPRLFSRPNNTNNWASKVTFGERIWLNRSKYPIPDHHTRWSLFLSIITGIGFLIAVYGAFLNLLLPTVSGGLISWFGKMWFCDRMVWLYEDMKDNYPQHLDWLTNTKEV